MYKYFACNMNVVDVVIKVKSTLSNFADYGCAVTEPKTKRTVYGWIEVIQQLSDRETKELGLFLDF